ncbi:MAG TPA: hypothetical protein VHZ03_19850 [Trebonia sp.]|jgi:hypothetical protein|nr:hypothetical protein [Trebonia sp.]
MSLGLSIAGLFLSVIAVGASTLLLVRQTAFMRHANEIPILTNLYQEFRSPDFQKAQDYVRNSLAPSFNSSLGISELPDEARYYVRKVANFYTSLGALIVLRLADEKFVISLLGNPADRTWKVLEPYILREREVQGNDDILAFYEDMVHRIRENYPVTKAYGIKVKRVTNSVMTIGYFQRTPLADNMDTQVRNDEP